MDCLSGGWGGGGTTHNWWVEDKRGRLCRAEAKRMVRGTSNRARQW
jgi:hypothetical protein